MADDEDSAYLPAFQQFMDVYIGPELARRRERGELASGLKLFAAQVVFYSDGRNNIVRINEEVRAVARGRTAHPVTKGQSVTWADIPELSEIELDPSDDPDAGHITALATPKGWLFAFDARYNRGLSRKHLRVAHEFLRASQAARSREDWNACVDTLFTACELAARARLLALPNPKFRSGTTHPEIKKRFRSWAQIGNVEPHEHAAFNKLSAWRRNARYLDADLHIDVAAIDGLILTVEGMINKELQRTTRRFDEKKKDEAGKRADHEEDIQL